MAAPEPAHISSPREIWSSLFRSAQRRFHTARFLSGSDARLRPQLNESYLISHLGAGRRGRWRGRRRWRGGRRVGGTRGRRQFDDWLGLRFRRRLADERRRGSGVIAGTVPLAAGLRASGCGRFRPGPARLRDGGFLPLRRFDLGRRRSTGTPRYAWSRRRRASRWRSSGGGGGGAGGGGGGAASSGMLQDDLLFEVFGSNLIQRAGGDPRGGKAQCFRLGEHLFVVQAELL